MFNLLSLAALVVAEEAPLKSSMYEYTAEEFSKLSIIDRVKVNDWRLELITLGFTVVFVILFVFGDRYNKRLVTKLLAGLRPVLDKNFALVGTSEGVDFIKDSSEAYSSYASGRENVSAVNINFKLKPRNNLFVWSMEWVLSNFTETVHTPIDKVDIVITPSQHYDNFITAIVSKLGMNNYRKWNYYLSLTKTSDSAKLPESFVFMSEANEFQEKILTAELEAALDIQSASFIKYIAFTDQPAERPEEIREFHPRRRIIISVDAVTGAAQLEKIGQVVQAALEIVDKLVTKEISFRTETLKKVVKVREAELSKVVKAQEAIKAEQEADEKAKIKKQEREKLRRLSPEEQAKLERKEMEKKQRKLQKKQRVRM